MNNKTILILAIISVFLISAPGFAEIKKIGFENRHTARIALSENDDDFYLTRAQGLIDYNFPQLNKIIKILPFFEYQFNFDTNGWWRKELGTEIGTSFFNDCFYWGASFQHVWQRKENYPVELLDETTEWESRFVINPPLRWWIFKDKLILRFFDEYTYDFTRGQATFNETGVIFDWQINEKVKVPIGWRHIDRVHDFDSDTMEASVVLSF